MKCLNILTLLILLLVASAGQGKDDVSAPIKIGWGLPEITVEFKGNWFKVISDAPAMLVWIGISERIQSRQLLLMVRKWRSGRARLSLHNWSYKAVKSVKRRKLLRLSFWKKRGLINNAASGC